MFTFSYFNSANNVFAGLDLALFAEEPFRVFNNNEGEHYAVVNLDLLQNNMEKTFKYKKQLSAKYSKCYVVENTTFKNNVIKDYLYCGYADTLFKVFYNASYVITNRLHTSVACILGSTPFKYEGEDQGGELGRNTLFNKFGITLLKGKEYSLEEIKTAQVKIKTEKDKFMKLLQSTFC